MVSTKDYPSVEEGWVGAPPWRNYTVQKREPQRTLRITIPEREFMQLSDHARQMRLRSARSAVARMR